MINSSLSNMKQKVNTNIQALIKIKNFEIILVLFLSFWAVAPLFHSGFFPMHDDEQVGRLFDLDQALKAFHIPPRIAPNLGFGYGYPFFNFYPPFASYIAEIFKMIGFSYIGSIKIMIGLGFILAAFSMYLFSKEFFGKAGGIVSAVLYTYAPYHAVDAYVRGALAELWSFVFLPAIFWSYYKLAQTSSSKFIIITGIFNACLILSHNLVAFMAVPFILVWFVFLLLNNKNKSKFAVNIILSFFLGLGLTAYFCLPAYFEKQYTMVDLLTTELANYAQHFVYLRQLWDSPWGYGGSIYGLLDGLSFQVGKIHLILAALGGILLIYLLRLRNYLSFRPAPGVKEIPGRSLTSFEMTAGKVILVFYLMFFVSIFMTTFYSKFVWDNIQPLWYVQFPWRFLLFSAFTSSFIAGSIFAIKFQRQIKFLLLGLIILTIIFTTKDYFQPSRYLPHASDEDYISREILRWKTSNMAFEYVPKGIATKKSSIGNTIVDIEKNEIAEKSYKVIAGNLNVRVIEETPQSKKFQITAYTNSIFRINTYSFPGWKVYVDGHEVVYNDNNSLKLITINLPAGRHTVTARFTDTLYRTLGNIVSLISIFFVFAYFVIVRHSRGSDPRLDRGLDPESSSGLHGWWKKI